MKVSFGISIFSPGLFILLLKMCYGCRQCGKITYCNLYFQSKVHNFGAKECSEICREKFQKRYRNARKQESRNGWKMGESTIDTWHPTEISVEQWYDNHYKNFEQLYKDRSCHEHPINGTLKTRKYNTIADCSVDGKTFELCWDTNCNGVLIPNGDFSNCRICGTKHIRCHSCELGSDLVDNNKGSECIVCKRHICQLCRDVSVCISCHKQTQATVY